MDPGSTVVGRFHSAVHDRYVPYVLPEAHGHRGEVRRLSLTGETGFGIEVEVEGRPTLGFYRFACVLRVVR